MPGKPKAVFLPAFETFIGLTLVSRLSGDTAVSATTNVEESIGSSGLLNNDRKPGRVC